VAVVEIRGLYKTYRSVRRGERVALSGFDMAVEPGQVHGFLGPNGSGKTTTLRTLLGLVRPDGGTMGIFGQPVPAALPEIAHRVGAIVESPQFFGNFTGRRTLHLLAAAGGVPAGRVDEVLERVGLRDRGDERVKAYSLGMKQRLAVASALLKSPELLILDEPANGLDPAGIREMRDLMRDLAADGVTVLVSSHILAEIQLICDSVTIISRGRRVAAGPVAEVVGRFDRREFRVRVADHERAAQIVAETGLPVTVHNDGFVVGDITDPTTITRTLAEHELWVAELTPLTPDLESVFLELTGSMPAPGRHLQVDETVLPPGPVSAAPAPNEPVVLPAEPVVLTPAPAEPAEPTEPTEPSSTGAHA
jgi:ABC-2 type transport system ATP-binding protein